jgi:hypothetical protein
MAFLLEGRVLIRQDITKLLAYLIAPVSHIMY